MAASGRTSAWSDDRVPRRSGAVAEQRARDRRVLLNIDTGRYYTLEGAADPIWELCDGRNTVGAIIAAVCERYGTDPLTARRDAIELLDDLLVEGLVDAA
jgi:hypothetical protein